MRFGTSPLAFAFLTLAFVSCSKQPSGGNYHERLANLNPVNTKVTPQPHDPDKVLPGRHLSERQVADIALNSLPPSSGYRFEFKDGAWNVFEVQPSVWGVASQTTHANGKVTVQSTNATRLVLRVRDADGKVEPIKTP